MAIIFLPQPYRKKLIKGGIHTKTASKTLEVNDYGTFISQKFAKTGFKFPKRVRFSEKEAELRLISPDVSFSAQNASKR